VNGWITISVAGGPTDDKPTVVDLAAAVESVVPTLGIRRSARVPASGRASMASGS